MNKSRKAKQRTAKAAARRKSHTTNLQRKRLQSLDGELQRLVNWGMSSYPLVRDVMRDEAARDGVADTFAAYGIELQPILWTRNADDDGQYREGHAANEAGANVCSGKDADGTLASYIFWRLNVASRSNG